MSDRSNSVTNLPPDQKAIRAKCYHPTGTFVEFARAEVEQSIPSRFEKIVSRYPDRVAIQTNNHVLTYAELNATANRIARTILQQQGDTAEAIGLLCEKSAALMAAMLGVLKAGKFFVLLDPSFPESRNAALLEDSQAGLLVTDRQHASLARRVASSRCPQKELESIDPGIPAKDLRLPISSKALAFITYTSGSTGQPKGLVQNHRNILHDVMLRANTYHICERDRVSLLASSTSNAIKNVFYTLLNGAMLLPFDVQKEGATRLASWLSQERISVCRISSPLFRNLTETLTGNERFPDLRLIQLASDVIYKSDIDLCKRYFSPDCMVATGISSSETGLMRDYLIDSRTDIAGSEVPVGYAVEGKEVLLLDDAGKEVGFNEVGEIVIRSRYLSPGYWRRPELTKAKFRPDPDGGDKDLYFTGDLGLMLPGGCLLHKGRKDFRIKVRGYGVEIAEVEKALNAHPAIKHAVVVARPNGAGEVRLVAYLVPSTRPLPNVSALRSLLREKLPDYMIPNNFLTLEKIPLTPGGKIDRQALPEPSSSRPELDTPYATAESPVEKELALIWAGVLSLAQVGIHDNFFDLGGHSLAATRVVSRVIKSFQVAISLQSLFQTPTVAQMAAVIIENQAKDLGKEELDRLLAELETMSDDQAQRHLV
jgi:amino acid adenylation domain-containing protein